MLIPQECIDARLLKIHQKAPLLKIEFDWGLKPNLDDIPSNARVFVDAWKDMSFMRFDYGNFHNIVQPNNISLTELDSWTSASFVVRIVQNGIILAASKKHTVSIAQPDLKSRRSLIIADYEDLGERPWKLDIYEDIPIPRLVFNERWWNELEEKGKSLSDDSKVMGMIMPAVLENMLNFLIISLKSDLHRWHQDPSWKGAWIRFARNLLPDGIPEYIENETDESEFLSEASNWISQVVKIYSDSKSLTSNLINWVGVE